MSRQNAIRFATFVAVSLLVTGVISCSQTVSESPSHHPEAITVDSHGLHLVRNDQLREVMADLKELTYDGLIREVESSHIRPLVLRDAEPKLERIAALANALADDAEVIPMIFEEPAMGQEPRRVLNQLAARLRYHALQLGDSAHQGDIASVKSSLDQVVKTCIACHASFR